ncbi:PC4/YdbC family ssDNA-binding protein [Fictibacillus sp. UD]|uniref:YdbC family protein n=1 Tax=Fictibacillus sp. UD TaxID=3038777 RepID=UPI003746DAA2
MANIKFEIIESIGVLSESGKGWRKELNLISWNDRDPKYDLREWSENHEKMGKGITLSKEEVASLKSLINNID